MKDIVHGMLVWVYRAIGQGDSDHGEAPYHTVGWYMTEQEANEAAKTAGAWGSQGKVERRQVLRDGDRYYEIKEIEISSLDLKKAREEALKKLTLAERKLLGL